MILKQIKRVAFFIDLTEAHYSNGSIYLFLEGKTPIAANINGQLHVLEGLSATLNCFVLDKWANSGLSFPKYQNLQFFTVEA